MGSSGWSSPLSTSWEGGWKNLGNNFFWNRGKTTLTAREIHQNGKITNLQNPTEDRRWCCAATMCSLPTVFLHTPLSFRSQINSSRNKKIQETEKIQSLWECLITIILSFSWMFTKRSIYFCIKTCAVPIKADWRRVLCDWANSSQKMICQKTKNTSKKEQMKGKTISYLKNICEPYFFQTTC